QRRNNHKDLQHRLFACFLSQIEPKKISKALEDEIWVDAMQEELLQFKIQKVWILVDLPYGKKAIGTKWVYRNKKDDRGVMVRNKARIEAIRIFLAFASYMGFIVYQMDVKSAFLYGTIDEEVYVSQPPGFVDPKFPKKVYKVVKAFYSLHQAPRASYDTLSTFLLKSGYNRGTINKTLFIKKDKNDIMLVQVYVDDIIFGSTKKSWCDEFEALMKSRFQMSSMGELYKSNRKKMKPLTKDEEVADVDVHLYRSVIGSLMYLTASRPDIMFAVCACSRFSDYAGANLDWKSTTGEAEYVVAANCCGQVLWIQNQMLDYGFNFMNTKIYIDNESIIRIVKNLVFHSKTKHIEISHHFIRDAYEKKLIQVLQIHTDNNVAHLLTKAFDVSSLIHHAVTAVVVTEASIKSSLLLHDADGMACLTNEAIFQNLAIGRDSLKGTDSAGDQVQPSHDSPLSGGPTSDRAEGGMTLEELYVLCTNLSNRVLVLEASKDAQAAEIIKLKTRIKKMKKKSHPVISHHRAWLRSVSRLSIKRKLGRKESISKQGRKNAKPRPTLDAFDDLDADLAHGMEYMDTEEAVNEKGGSTVSSVRLERVSTAGVTINTADPKISDVEPRTPPITASIFDNEDVTMAQTLIKMKEEKAKEKGVAFKDVKDSSRPARSILTLKPLLIIDPKDKGKSVLQKPKPAKKMDKSDFDAAQIARDVEIARQLEVDWQAEEERKRQREEEASKAAIAEMYDEVQAGIDADALFAAKLQQEEREEYTIEERAKFLAETIVAQRKFRDAQRSNEIRNRPPTKSQLRNLMMTYLKNMGGYKHSQLKVKSFEEIKGMYERQNKSIQDFVPIGSAEEEKLIKKMNEKETAEDTSNKEKVLEEPYSTKVKVKQQGNTESTRKRPDRRLKMKATKKSKRYGKPHDYYRDFKADGSSRYIKTFTEMVSRFHRLDFNELHSLVMIRFETSTPEGIDLILWGSLRTMFEANAEDDLWKNQEEWILKSWNFYDNCGVHILVLEDGTEFYMLAERRYPLTKETLERMLALRLIAESESEAVFDLLRFIQQQIDESGSHDGSEKDL
ncbi:putative ribonuclease H-like domain-containing protein, partial [Tanacetum coccineum]